MKKDNTARRSRNHKCVRTGNISMPSAVPTNSDYQFPPLPRGNPRRLSPGGQYGRYGRLPGKSLYDEATSELTSAFGRENAGRLRKQSRKAVENFHGSKDADRRQQKAGNGSVCLVGQALLPVRCDIATVNADRQERLFY